VTNSGLRKAFVKQFANSEKKQREKKASHRNANQHHWPATRFTTHPVRKNYNERQDRCEDKQPLYGDQARVHQNSRELHVNLRPLPQAIDHGLTDIKPYRFTTIAESTGRRYFHLFATSTETATFPKTQSMSGCCVANGKERQVSAFLCATWAGGVIK
jgi:hypothetical protein